MITEKEIWKDWKEITITKRKTMTGQKARNEQQLWISKVKLTYWSSLEITFLPLEHIINYNITNYSHIKGEFCSDIAY